MLQVINLGKAGLTPHPECLAGFKHNFFAHKRNISALDI